jgi:hypothetical protein
MMVNKILAEELFEWAGEERRQAFYNQDLGSYWLIEFRAKIGAELLQYGEVHARLSAHAEISQFFAHKAA